MASTSETGHAKNVAHFESLISFCTGYSTSYNPSNAAIQLSALNTLLTSARDSLASVTVAKTEFANASNDRQDAFASLRALCTRIINALQATNASDLLVKDAISINKKIQGKRVGSKPAPTPEVEEAADKTISVSQQSFDSLIENFSKLIDLLVSTPAYAPNETELQVVALTNTLNDLKAANTAAIIAYTGYSNLLIARNIVLYRADNGLVDTSLDVKKYVKSVFGTTSPQFTQVSQLKFSNRSK